MGEIVTFPIPIDSDLGRALMVDCARFQEGIVTEKAFRKKYKFDEAAWEKLNDDAFVRAIEEESVRRIRDGFRQARKGAAAGREGAGCGGVHHAERRANDRHRLDACKVLNDFSANGPQGVPAADRFQITINLGTPTEPILKNTTGQSCQIRTTVIPTTPHHTACFRRS